MKRSRRHSIIRENQELSLRKYKKQVVGYLAVAVSIVLLVSAGVLYVPTIFHWGSVSYTGYGFQISANSVNPTLGLDLYLSLSSAVVKPGNHITFTIAENSTLPRENNISAENLWPMSGMTLGGCGTLNYPFGISIFRGNYDQNNISSSQRGLQFWSPGIYNCPLILTVKSYLFASSSFEATLGVPGEVYSPRLAPGTFGPLPMWTNLISADGSWTLHDFLGMGGPTYHEFSSGLYTVIAGDEWGDSVILHFAVS